MLAIRIFQAMRLLSGIALTIFLSHQDFNAQTTVSGNVYGTWNEAGNPYVIIDNCTVPNQQFLKIEAGVTVIVGKNLSITVEGQINATGTPDKHIVIKSPEQNIFWNQINIRYNAGNNMSKFIYCDISNAQYAIHLQTGFRSSDSMVTLIKNCSFNSCQKAAIFGEAHGYAWNGGAPTYFYYATSAYVNPIIENCTFSSDQNGCLFIADGEKIIYNPYYGTSLIGYGYTSPVIKNNIFKNIAVSALDLYSGNIYAGKSYPIFANNNIVNGYRGVQSQDPFYPEIRNNIFYSNEIGVERTGTTTTQVSFNCFFNNNSANFIGFPPSYGLIVMQNNNGDQCDIAFNILMDPIFSDSAYLAISDSSPCIDAGSPHSNYFDTYFPPSKGTNINDIGALGGPEAGGWKSSIPTYIEEKDAISPNHYDLYQNYPNPFNSLTTIRFVTPISSSVKLKIYNIYGQEIATLVNEYKPRGVYSVIWKATDLPSGVYISKIWTEKFEKSRKLVLVK